MLNKNIYKKNDGFTLVEILIVIGITLMISYILFAFISTSFKSIRFVSEQETATQNARRGLEYISKEVRGANSSEQGNYPLSRVDEYDFIFYSDVDDDGQTERVRYIRSGTNLYRVVTEPGALNDYSGNIGTTTISQYINNDEEPIFNYYDNDYNIAASINTVRLVKVHLRVNVTPTISPNDYDVYTDVHLRNLKDNL